MKNKDITDQKTLISSLKESPLEELNRLREENSELRKIVSKSVTALRGTEKAPRSVEREICEVQLDRLRELSEERPLTLEECKRLDLLVKNLYITKKPSIKVDGKKIKEESIETAHLLEIVNDSSKD